MKGEDNVEYKTERSIAEEVQYNNNKKPTSCKLLNAIFFKYLI